MTGFKRCSCGCAWRSRDEFLSDPEVRLAGYQVNFVVLKEGFFLFTHEAPTCGTTLAVRVMAFEDMYGGAVFQRRATGTAGCGGHCLRSDDCEPCPEECECAYVRQILATVASWPKSGRRAAS